MRLEGSRGGKRNAKKLRREMTPPEITLWLALRQNAAGLCFRKQHAVGAVVGGVAAIKVLTSLLAPEQYGMFSLALTLAVFSQQVWAGPLQQAINRYVAPYLQTLRLPELIATGTFVYLRIALVQAILLLCGIVAA